MVKQIRVVGNVGLITAELCGTLFCAAERAILNRLEPEPRRLFGQDRVAIDMIVPTWKIS
jgi:hypothetical protein